MEYAIIDNQSLKVLGIILWDGENDWRPPEGTFVIKLTEEQLQHVTVDWKYIDEEFVPDPEDVQEVIQEPLSEPEPLTPEQKLESAGLTVDELKQLLGL